MDRTAEARARAADSLDEAARALKRVIGTCRSALQVVRQTQAEVIGIEVETITEHGGVQSGTRDSAEIREQTDRIVEEALGRSGERQP